MARHENNDHDSPQPSISSGSWQFFPLLRSSNLPVPSSINTNSSSIFPPVRIKLYKTSLFIICRRDFSCLFLSLSIYLLLSFSLRLPCCEVTHLWNFNHLSVESYLSLVFVPHGEIVQHSLLYERTDGDHRATQRFFSTKIFHFSAANFKLQQFDSFFVSHLFCMNHRYKIILIVVLYIRFCFLLIYFEMLNILAEIC